MNMEVAPLVGAWIEILGELGAFENKVSLPSWERGLKSDGAGRSQATDECRSPRGSVD